MFISRINEGLRLFNILVDQSRKYPEVIHAAKVWAMNYGGNLTKSQTHDFFVALRLMPNVQEAWHAWDKMPEKFKRVDLNGFRMCFHNELAHNIAEENK